MKPHEPEQDAEGDTFRDETVVELALPLRFFRREPRVLATPDLLTLEISVSALS